MVAILDFLILTSFWGLIQFHCKQEREQKNDNFKMQVIVILW